MKIDEFNYHLPQELIASFPADKRDESKLMTIDRESGKIGHHKFHEIVDHLQEGDILVLNNSKVIPARLIGRKTTGGKIEILLNHQLDNGSWQCLGKGLKTGVQVVFDDSVLTAKVEQKMDQNYIVKFNRSGPEFFREIEKIGLTPLPPYIEKKRLSEKTGAIDDKERYQTVYAKSEGSVAAPTAGLHFTDCLLQKIKAKGVNVLEVTLHVGLGTFQPVKTENIEDHLIHEEFFEVSADTLRQIVEAKRNKSRVIAVGTTAARVLEHVMSDDDFLNTRSFKKISGWTQIYIYPGYRFSCIDGIITNFHLPKSSLLLLISAFAGVSLIKKSYREAILEKYRFYSYGDAMFII